MPSMPGWSWSACPTLSPGPMTRLIAPFGRPASRYASMSLIADHGDRLDGLKTTVLPADERGARRAGREGHREVERAHDPEHAVRPQDRPGVDGRVAEIAHLDVVAVVLLHRVAVVAQQVGRLLDLAERLDAVLADLEAHDRGLVHEAVADELGRAADDLETIAPGSRGPSRLGGTSRGDGVVDVLGRAGRERPDDEVAVDRRGHVERRRAIAPGAIDVVSIVAAEARPDPRRRLLEPAMEVLVVGAEGRVGDLDPRLLVGGHCRVVPHVVGSGPAGRGVGAWSREPGVVASV